MGRVTAPRARVGTRLPPIVWLALVASAYVVAGKLGLSLAFVNANATAVWPPTGIALAALLLLGYGMWPGILLGAFLVNLTTTGDALSSIGIAAGNTLEALVAARLVIAFAGGPGAFERPQDVFRFTFLAALLSTILSATIGVLSLSLTGHASWSDFAPIWFTWWLGDASGALIIAPLLVLWAIHPPRRWDGMRGAERLLLLGVVAVTGLVLFAGLQRLSLERYPVPFLAFPSLVWIAFRFGPRESATSVFVLSSIAVWGTVRGLGPFARPDPNESLLLLQGFLAVASVVSLALAAAVLDRQRAEAASRMTERRLRRAAEDAARLREEFLSVATHELRTPVTSLSGYAQLALRAVDHRREDRLRPALAHIVRQSERLATLIGQLLDASRIQGGGLAIEPRPTDLSALTTSAVDAAKQTTEAHHWAVEIGPGVFAAVDPVRWEQVLENLLTNAIRYSPNGTTIAVELDTAGPEVRLRVSDEGPGIAPEHASRIFERFYRAHEEQGLGGLGLGLYITREIVDRHGGRIDVSSTPGSGTTFTVTLPSVTIPIARPPEPPAPRDARDRKAIIGRVLVVDDDADIRALAAELLREVGIDADTAESAAAGLETAARRPPDLVILDKLMPGMGGTEFAAAYRRTVSPAPIVAFCAARDAADWATAIGAVGHIQKPFDVEDFKRIVIDELSRQRSPLAEPG